MLCQFKYRGDERFSRTCIFRFTPGRGESMGFPCVGRGPMDKALACGAGDCRFESCRGHTILIYIDKYVQQRRLKTEKICC